MLTFLPTLKIPRWSNYSVALHDDTRLCTGVECVKDRPNFRLGFTRASGERFEESQLV